ncbi:MAG: hypothetical protein R6U46_09175 [Marinilabilia sp.]
MYSRLFLFNPTNEMAIANGQVSYMPPRHLFNFEKDLATLPWIFGTKNDFVLIPEKAGHSLEFLNDHGWDIPNPVSGPGDIPEWARGNLVFEPWGWSPAVYRQFRPFYEMVHPGWHNHPFSSWEKAHATILSRDTGYSLLNTISVFWKQSPDEYPLLYLPGQPLVVYHQKELASVMKQCTPPLLVKTPWSASGRGLFRIRDNNDDPSRSPWVKGMLQRQGKIYIEKTLDKIQDVSFQFFIEKGRIQYLGHNFFYADQTGQFSGCAVGPPVNEHPLFQDQGKIDEAVRQGAHLVKKGLENLSPELNYTGPAGVDGIFFRDENNQLKLQPCLEINLRYNMGLANIYLKRFIHPDARGIWKTGAFNQINWEAFCHQRKQENPPQLMKGKLRRGFLPLISPVGNKNFGVWLETE